jgi:Zn-dependent protease with chaperone function
MTTSGPAIYFDGISSAQRDVLVELADAALRIVGADGRSVDAWRYGDLRRESAPDHILRLGRAGQSLLARIEIRSHALAAEIGARAASLDASGARERRTRIKVVAWSFAAIASLVTGAVVGVPALATKIAPYVPASVELRLGNAVDRQIRGSIDTRHLGAGFECGTIAVEQPGRAALDKLVGRLEAAGPLPFPLRVSAVRRPEFNAFAMPGGHVYVYQGLIAKAETPDELAGTIAHELGHVAHRDSTRTVLQAAGLSFMFGMLLGDFVGGGAVVIAAKTVLRSSYSRQVESAADAYSVALMRKVGGDQHALATILTRMVADKDRGVKILRDHPATKERIAAIDAIAESGPTTALLEPAEWAALKQICSERKASAGPTGPDAARTRTGPADGDTPHR